MDKTLALISEVLGRPVQLSSANDTFTEEDWLLLTIWKVMEPLIVGGPYTGPAVQEALLGVREKLSQIKADFDMGNGRPGYLFTWFDWQWSIIEHPFMGTSFLYISLPHRSVHVPIGRYHTEVM